MNLGRIVPLTFVQLCTFPLSFHEISTLPIFSSLFFISFQIFHRSIYSIPPFLLRFGSKKDPSTSEGSQIYIYQSKKLIPGKFPIPLFSGSPFRRFCHSKRPPPCAQQQDCARRRNKAASASGCIFK